MPMERKLDLFQEMGYLPTMAQWPIHQGVARVKQVLGGERAGKSYVTHAEAACCLYPQPEDQGPRRVIFGAREYLETRPEMLYMIETFSRLNMIRGRPSTPKRGPWSFETVTKGRCSNVSFDDSPQALTGRGEAYDCVAICEAGRLDQSPVQAAWGRVTETRGLVLLSGSLWDDTGWYNDLAEQMQGPNTWGGKVFSLPSWSNSHVFPGGRMDAEIVAWERALSNIPGAFDRRVAAKIVPSPARYYPEFDPAIHVSDEIVYNQNQPVYLTIDPGYFPSHYVVLAIQIGRTGTGLETVDVVDEFYLNRKVHQDVIRLCLDSPWWERVRDVTGGHETKGHHYNISTEEAWRRGTDVPFNVIVKPAAKMHETMRVHTFLFDPVTKEPRIRINPRCEGLASEFPLYKRKTDSDHKVISDEPAYGVVYDALDALTNFLLWRYGVADLHLTGGRPGRTNRGAKG